MFTNSKVESYFYSKTENKDITTKTPYIKVDNFPELGLLTSLRFIEWVSENPEGVISLPTGKTPEYFIKYTKYLLNNWNSKKGRDILSKHGLHGIAKPNLSGLQFVQIDEFYPINPAQHNSFYNYVNNFYINNFNLDKKKALLINSNEIPLYKNKPYSVIFPDSKIDLSLRYRDATSYQEEMQQASIFLIDDWCNVYEQKIKEKGGIGFFLGGIGPDGHIAFNVRGSSHFSTTRLTGTNFKTQAVAASDLGGIEISRNHLVITIGLQTITQKPDVTAIIFAAGEAKADVVKDTLESDVNVLYPGTALQKCKNARFYLTQGAASKLNDTLNHYYYKEEWNYTKTQKAVIDLSKKIDKYVSNITVEDLKNDIYCKNIPNINEDTVKQVISTIEDKLHKGLENKGGQVIYHTGPHHDDILLGIFPYVNRQLRHDDNEIHFTILTSGFNAVTNNFVIEKLDDLLYMLSVDKVQMIHYDNFFYEGYKLKTFKDVSHYLDAVAENNDFERKRGFSHRLVRSIVETYNIDSKRALKKQINAIKKELINSYSGSKDSPDIQKLKGMIREYEEELVWGYYGVPNTNIHHLRLGFYKGDIFTEQPEEQRDVLPILNQLREIKPNLISLAMDPESSGPDTHYKVLQAIAKAVKEWEKEKDLSDVKILGYRNVWFRFHPAEADMLIPVSLNALSILQSSFTESYHSQVNASFPSYEYDGKFSDLTQKIWVEQMRQTQLILGKDYFYNNKMQSLRATHGMIYVKLLSVAEFVEMAEHLEKIMEGISIL
ncbi:MAG: hypothetical protein WBH98_08680 [Bacteroidales bacterium]